MIDSVEASKKSHDKVIMDGYCMKTNIQLFKRCLSMKTLQETTKKR